MSKQLITEYYNNYDRVVQFSKSKNEQTIRTPFFNLLNYYARKQNYELVAEVSTQGTRGVKVRPDGILKNLFGLDNGLWESKDEKDTIDDEIDAKRKKGYPFNNILFEDSNTAVLFQRGEEVMRAKVREPNELHKILTEFVTFKSETVYKFETALENFKADIPSIVETLRKRIDETGEKNKNFKAAGSSFLELCKAEINPEITLDDVREMMIQHILTADIFNKIFDDPGFHRHNNIARELEKLNEILFTHSERKNLLGEIEHYYDTINACASGITDHHEKQKFLKVLYENFYKVYNPKAADRLGVVYTPNEIVQFMIESTNYLLEKHFGKNMADKNVDILDPATGTGTFITAIIDSIPKQNLAHKYQHELHANEVAILPYYIANLNIEFTFKQKMGYYDEFKNLCFVDTLDNVAGLEVGLGGKHSSYKSTGNLFALTSENAERIKRQNSKKISVIIGNPPYNAKQENYNYQNSNKAYRLVDKRIKDTYIKYGTAQNQIVIYDMYTRFLRWATDRIDKNGIIAFVSNSSFIDGNAFDGFRKCIAEEFSELHVINLKGNARTSGERRRQEGGNVFSDLIRVGVAVYFLVKTDRKQTFKVYYDEVKDYSKAEEKKEYLRVNKLRDIRFQEIIPENNNWINIADTDWYELMPLVAKEAKSGKSNAIFKLFSRGIATQRDEWVYDFNKENVYKKANYLIEEYEKKRRSENYQSTYDIKWDRELSKYLKRGIAKKFERENIIVNQFRPYSKHYFYFDEHFNGMTYQWFDIFNFDDRNFFIAINSPGNTKDFHCLCADTIIDLHLTGDSQCIPLYRYDQNGNRIENISDWGLEQFTTHYKDKKIKKEDVFHYTYAVLHNPAYRKKYELNLKREFPRLPFYKDFWQWAKWGKQLMDLHINYEKAKAYSLKENHYEVKAEAKRQKEIFTKAQEPEALYAIKPKVKVKLKADKLAGIIELDELSFLSGVPKEAWEYKLGNRSALEWILDQYKEKKPSDPTIAEKFNTYRFADYKEHVIDLLKRVCTVSVETMKVIREMEEEK